MIPLHPISSAQKPARWPSGIAVVPNPPVTIISPAAAAQPIQIIGQIIAKPGARFTKPAARFTKPRLCAGPPGGSEAVRTGAIARTLPSPIRKSKWENDA